MRRFEKQLKRQHQIKPEIMKFDHVYIYRMTHIGNIPHILENGITHRNDSLANSNYSSIGDISMIRNRTHKKVKVDNGNHLDLNVPSIVLGDFIPFYFGIKMPTLYVIKHGGNFVKRPISSEKIVYLACRLKSVTDVISEYYFTDGHAIDAFTTFYDATKIENIDKLVNWEAVKADYWGGEENLNLKRKKQAEFLSGERIPPNLIYGFVCYNKKTQKELINGGIPPEKIKIFRKAYF